MTIYNKSFPEVTPFRYDTDFDDIMLSSFFGGDAGKYWTSPSKVISKKVDEFMQKYPRGKGIPRNFYIPEIYGMDYSLNKIYVACYWWKLSNSVTKKQIQQNSRWFEKDLGEML
jgi:hypothetical protein